MTGRRFDGVVQTTAACCGIVALADPVVVAAWLAMLAPAMGGSALRRRVARSPSSTGGMGPRRSVRR